MKDNTTGQFKGLHRENSFEEQPKDTLRFALNAVTQSREGDLNHITNEEGNQAIYNLGIGFTPLGSISVGNEDTVVFSVNTEETISKISLVNKENIITTIVEADLGFKLENRIDAVFKLRRGCERMLYFTTPTPMFFNLDRVEKFQNNSGEYEVSKFLLFRRYEFIPIFQNFQVNEGGVLNAGSYNFAIQYLDEDFNPTEWITTSETINIYHDSISKSWHDRRGSTNAVNFYQNFGGSTNKKIDINLTALDTTYIYYRLAVIEATAGTGLITGVKVSDPISTSTEIITYSGNNFPNAGTIEEIQEFSLILEEAEHILQLENRLILSNVKGNSTNLCRLQQFASKIQSTFSLRTQIIDADSRENNKNGAINTEFVGYMPGEIYSFGIVYIFDDNSMSPVYHIPGRNVNNGFSGMSTNNELENTLYIDNSECADIDYWGVDSEGEALKGKPVRHHRFPTREEIGEPLFSDGNDYYTTLFRIEATGTILDSYTDNNIEITVVYDYDGGAYQNTFTINRDNYGSYFKEDLYVGTQPNIGSSFLYENGVQIDLNNPSPVTGINYAKNLIVGEKRNSNHKETKILGIRFAGLEKPPKEVTGNREVVGYQIVRNEATEDNRTILDSGALLPMLENNVKNYVSAGIINYDLGATFGDIHKKDIYALIHPEHMFLGKEYKNISALDFIGRDSATVIYRRSFLTQDVAAGTSYNSDVHKKKDGDGDGFTLHILSERIRNSFNNILPTGITNSWTLESDFNEVFYLDALADKTTEDSTSTLKKVYNLSADNKLGIVALNKTFNTSFNQFPYVMLRRDLSDPYAAFRTDPYYLESKQYHRFVSTDKGVSIFNGDAYVSPLNFNSSVFNDIRLADRNEKSGVWNIVVGVLAIIVGVIISIVTYGSASAIGVMAIGFGISQIASGVKKEKIAQVYQKEYEDGLQDTVIDGNAEAAFGVPNPASGYSNDDDEIQWRGCAKIFYFESRIPIGLRKGSTVSATDFMNTEEVEGSNTPSYRNNPRDTAGDAGDGGAELDHDVYMLDKLTVVDADNDSGRLYRGYPVGEIYEINSDYLRRNKEKVFFHLPLQYDCCSDCLEEFPHRVHYSEQSFQEELSDNYQIFFANNYRDIEAETGVITNMFKIQNNLYIHTEECLWHLPQNIQERVTGDIVSFIGTGDFFSIPPRKIVDGKENSAGSIYKWGTLKTPHGIFFISDRERKIFQFDGSSLTPISDQGMFSWFKENMTSLAENFYSNANFGRDYRYRNSASEIGVGYITVYDNRNERILITERDFSMFSGLTSIQNFEIDYYNNEVYFFENYSEIINTQKELGFTLSSIGKGKLNFYNYTTNVSTEVDGAVIDKNLFLDKKKDFSWTLSYSLRDKSWTSFHSYVPDFYYSIGNQFYSWVSDTEFNNFMWIHNVRGLYNSFYQNTEPYIIEIVLVSNPTQVKIYDSLKLFTSEEDVTFNKIWLYNSKQSSGELELVIKDKESVSYLLDQIKNSNPASLVLSKEEDSWNLNGFRNLAVNTPLFFERYDSDLINYFSDKVIIESSLDVNKHWTQLESFRDKYLVVRLIFDNFDNKKLSANYLVVSENKSIN